MDTITDAPYFDITMLLLVVAILCAGAVLVAGWLEHGDLMAAPSPAQFTYHDDLGHRYVVWADNTDQAMDTLVSQYGLGRVYIRDRVWLASVEKL